MEKVTTSVFWQQMELLFTLPAPEAEPVGSALSYWQSAMAVPVTVLAAAAAGLMDAKHPCRSCPGCADRRCLVLQAYILGMNKTLDRYVDIPSSLGGIEYGTAE